MLLAQTGLRKAGYKRPPRRSAENADGPATVTAQCLTPWIRHDKLSGWRTPKPGLPNFSKKLNFREMHQRVQKNRVSESLSAFPVAESIITIA